MPTVPREGPKPLATLVMVLAMILIVALLFAWLKVQFGDALNGDLVAEEGTIDTYFCSVDDCEQALDAFLADAIKVECAFYDLDLPDIITRLQEKHASVLVFDENIGDLPFTPVGSPGLMHHKFCVQKEAILTGSMNPTGNGVHKNDNNLLVITSPTLARRYADEFNNLLYRSEGGRSTKSRTHPLYVNLSGTLIELRFCPQDHCEQAVMRELSRAQQDVRFMTFSFTSDGIGQSLIDASRRGVLIEGVFERRQIDQWTEHDKLQDAGIPVLRDGNPATMHHKVFIIDNATVITGSYNPTASGNERNDENLLIIHDARIAQAYLQEYARVRSTASP